MITYDEDHQLYDSGGLGKKGHDPAQTSNPNSYLHPGVYYYFCTYSLHVMKTRRRHYVVINFK